MPGPVSGQLEDGRGRGILETYFLGLSFLIQMQEVGWCQPKLHKQGFCCFTLERGEVL